MAGGHDEDYDETKDLIPGDNDKPSIYENYQDAPINLTRIPAEIGSGGVFDIPIETPPKL